MFSFQGVLMARGYSNFRGLGTVQLFFTAIEPVYTYIPSAVHESFPFLQFLTSCFNPMLRFLPT